MIDVIFPREVTVDQHTKILKKMFLFKVSKHIVLAVEYFYVKVNCCHSLARVK